MPMVIMGRRSRKPRFAREAGGDSGQALRKGPTVTGNEKTDPSARHSPERNRPENAAQDGPSPGIGDRPAESAAPRNRIQQSSGPRAGPSTLDHTRGLSGGQEPPRELSRRRRRIRRAARAARAPSRRPRLNAVAARGIQAARGGLLGAATVISPPRPPIP